MNNVKVDAETNLFDVVLKFGKNVKKSIDKGKNERVIIPEHEPIIKWQVKNFRYTKNGVETDGQEGSNDTKIGWYIANFAIKKKFGESKDFQFLNSIINERYPDAKDSLHVYLDRIIRQSLYNEKCDNEEIKKITNDFFKWLEGRLVKSGVIVHLINIILESQKIDFNNGISIRQPTIDDLEKESTLFSRNMNHMDLPSAILQIESLGERTRELHEFIHKSINILRLYKPGSIKYISYSMYTESFNPSIGGKISTLETADAQEKIYISNSETQNLINFWQGIEPDISKKISNYGVENLSFCDIAYQRYTDALLKQGTIEQRISTAIMGLESIFLRDDGETQELTYRLKFRVAKLLSHFGLEPLSVKDAIRDAYDVRSQFVHGSLLSYKKKMKYDKDYGGIKNLLMNILDYLRISIVNSVMMKISKDEMVDTIDSSFLDKKSEEKLHNITLHAKSLF